MYWSLLVWQHQKYSNCIQLVFYWCFIFSYIFNIVVFYGSLTRFFNSAIRITHALKRLILQWYTPVDTKGHPVLKWQIVLDNDQPKHHLVTFYKQSSQKPIHLTQGIKSYKFHGHSLASLALHYVNTVDSTLVFNLSSQTKCIITILVITFIATDKQSHCKTISI